MWVVSVLSKSYNKTTLNYWVPIVKLSHRVARLYSESPFTRSYSEIHEGKSTDSQCRRRATQLTWQSANCKHSVMTAHLNWRKLSWPTTWTLTWTSGSMYNNCRKAKPKKMMRFNSHFTESKSYTTGDLAKKQLSGRLTKKALTKEINY